jgi:hypothetical protein
MTILPDLVGSAPLAWRPTDIDHPGSRDSPRDGPEIAQPDGQETLACRPAVRADRLAGLLAGLSPQELDALAAALPAMGALADAQPRRP